MTSEQFVWWLKGYFDCDNFCTGNNYGPIPDYKILEAIEIKINEVE